MKGQLDRVTIPFILALFYWLKPLSDERGEESGVPGDNPWRRASENATCILSIYLVLFVLQVAHKASTRARQRCRSAETRSRRPRVQPFSFISLSAVLLQVSLGRPLFLWPSGVHRRAILVKAVVCWRSTCPIHRQRLTQPPPPHPPPHPHMHTKARKFKPQPRLEPALEHWWQARKADELTITPRVASGPGVLAPVVVCPVDRLSHNGNLSLSRWGTGGPI